MPSKRSWRTSSGAKAGSAGTRSVPRLGDETGRKIAVAFRGEGAKWRTVGGIARESGVPAKAVLAYLRSHEEWFQRAPVSPGGRQLYAIRTSPAASGATSRRAAAG